MSGPEWIRERGRADYSGWRLHIEGSRAHVKVGHPFWTCVFWLCCWRLRLLKTAPICGTVRTMRMERP